VFGNVGWEFFVSKRYDTALEWLTEAINRNADYVQAYSNRSAVYRAMGVSNLAKADLEKVLEVNPTYAAAYLWRSSSQREVDLKLPDLAKLFELRPDHLDGCSYYSRLLFARKFDLDRALEVLNVALDAIKKRIRGGAEARMLDVLELLRVRGEFHFLIGDFEAAAADHEELMEQSALPLPEILVEISTNKARYKSQRGGDSDDDDNDGIPIVEDPSTWAELDTAHEVVRSALLIGRAREVYDCGRVLGADVLALCKALVLPPFRPLLRLPNRYCVRTDVSGGTWYGDTQTGEVTASDPRLRWKDNVVSLLRDSDVELSSSLQRQYFLDVACWLRCNLAFSYQRTAWDRVAALRRVLFPDAATDVGIIEAWRRCPPELIPGNESCTCDPLRYPSVLWTLARCCVGDSADVMLNHALASLVEMSDHALDGVFPLERFRTRYSGWEDA
jgi:tetratricopeptide (TPR) repeat protein